jgi:hypothetical protein
VRCRQLGNEYIAVTSRFCDVILREGEDDGQQYVRNTQYEMFDSTNS